MTVTLSTENLSLDGLRSLTAVLERLPQGPQARALAEKLGLWTTATHNGIDSRKKAFPTNFSRLTEPDLSDTYAYWLSELFRTTELVGLLEGQRSLLSLQGKQVRASARARLRREHRAEAQRIDEGADAAAKAKAYKPPTVSELADDVEDEREVRDLDATMGLLMVVLESAKAYKEGALTATTGLSREISFRQAQMGARIR